MGRPSWIIQPGPVSAQGPSRGGAGGSESEKGAPQVLREVIAKRTPTEAPASGDSWAGGRRTVLV